jgi:hypothetical protein
LHNSSLAPGCGCWLYFIKKQANARFSSAEWREALSLWCLIPTTITDEICSCNSCGKELTNISPTMRDYHFLTCKYGGHVNGRHNALRNTIHYLANISGLPSQIEQRVIPGSNTRPADVCIHGENQNIVIDCAVTNPLRSIYRPEAITTTSHAANMYARLAKESIREQLESLNYAYYPCVLETFGAPSAGVKNIIDIIAGAYKVKYGTTRGAAIQHVRANIYSQLWKRNARAIVEKRVHGHGFTRDEARRIVPLAYGGVPEDDLEGDEVC